MRFGYGQFFQWCFKCYNIFECHRQASQIGILAMNVQAFIVALQTFTGENILFSGKKTIAKYTISPWIPIVAFHSAAHYRSGQTYLGPGGIYSQRAPNAHTDIMKILETVDGISRSCLQKIRRKTSTSNEFLKN